MHHIHITATTGSYEKPIILGLIEKGYAVSQASDIPWNKSAVAAYLISLQINKNYDIKSTSIYEDLISVLSDVGADYYSIVITPFAQDSLWANGNSYTDSDIHDQKAYN